jgi:apolipoprotein N-acyltransferase
MLLSVSWLYPQWFAASFVGHVMLVVFAMHSTPRNSLLMGCGSGTLALAIAFHWSPESITETTNLVWPWTTLTFLLLVMWESLIFGLFALMVSVATRRSAQWIWLAPAWWVSLEFLWPRVFTWAIAHTHTSVTPILQLAELAGTSGVSAMIILAVVATALMLHPPGGRRPYAAIAAALIVVVIAYGWGVIREKQIDALEREATVLRVAAIQVDPSFVDSVERMRAQSLAVQSDVDLVLWPESSLGHYHETLSDFRDPIRTSELSEAPNPAEDPSAGFRVELLAGGKTYRDGGRDCGPYCNTAFLIDPTKLITGKYVKRTLMPVGEYLPGESLFPEAREWAALTSALVRGTSDQPLRLAGGQQVGTLICYEDMIAANSRRTVLAGAELLVAIINGSGFRDEDTLSQHQRLAMLRTVENRRGMVRCAATGVTCYISPTGRVKQTIPTGGDNALVASVPMLQGLTLYTRWGEWFAWSCVAVTSVTGLRLRRFR